VDAPHIRLLPLERLIMALYRRFGGWAIITLITAFSVTASVLATYTLVTPLLTPVDIENGMMWVSLAIAVIVPALVAPAATMALVSLVVRLDAAYQTVLALSATDPLTDVANRRGLFSDAEARLSSRQSGHHALVGMIDLDQFKTINDSHGHHMGDLVLIDVVKRLQGAIGSAGLVGRIGGDEFAFLVTGPAADVDARARSIREHCALFTLHYDRLAVPVTVSVSIGMVPLEPGESFEQGLARADDALYARKGASHLSTKPRTRITRAQDRDREN
jgi:diguanylate cyclase (GGDEF)-like protein